jgi:hypothetical protein
MTTGTKKKGLHAVCMKVLFVVFKYCVILSAQVRKSSRSKNGRIVIEASVINGHT